MRKRLISFLMCFLMCVALIPVSAQATESTEVNAPAIPTEGDVWDGSIIQPTKFVLMDGKYYYEISKCSELAYVAQTGGDWLSGHYVLTNNLILNDITFIWDGNGNCLNDTSALLKWTPIDDFTGTFNGNGFVISGMYVSSAEDYAGLFGRAYGSTISNTIVVNSFLHSTSTFSYGGIGLIAGYSANTRNCISSGTVIGKSACAGGITGDGYVYDCTNYADVYCDGSAGGIAGEALTIVQCSNYGSVHGDNDVGGIVGRNFNEVFGSSNYGNVTGTENIGGIAGSCNSSTSDVNNCYNVGNISGISYCGGIVGAYTSNRHDPLTNCYSIGLVSSEDSVCNTIGAIAGSSQYVWGTFTALSCYYLKSESINTNLFGCGNVKDTLGKDPAGFYAKTVIELKDQTTFSDWDFTDIWTISADKNGGYPYLQWQESMLSNIPVSGISLSDTALNLATGDYAYLTATVSPANATNQTITWRSSDSGIATVSSAGKVTAISAGTAVITVTTEDGGYTASCTVTVTERMPEEYRLNSITVRDNDGAILSEISSGTCLATVSITNLASEGNTLVFLAAYTSTGQYQGMMWVSVEDLPVGATIKVTLPVDNSDGKTANLKAFTVASFSDLLPLGEAVSFLP